MKFNFYYLVSIMNFVFLLYDTIKNNEDMAKYSAITSLAFWLFGMLKEINDSIRDLLK